MLHDTTQASHQGGFKALNKSQVRIILRMKNRTFLVNDIRYNNFLIVTFDIIYISEIPQETISLL